MRQTCADIENNAYNEQRRADLRALQALPLKDKIKMTQELINEAIAVYGEKHVYVLWFWALSRKKENGINRFERLRQTHPKEYEWMVKHFGDLFDNCGIIY